MSGFTVCALSDGRLQAFFVPEGLTSPFLLITWMETTDDDAPWVEITEFEPASPPTGWGVLGAPIFLLRQQLWMASGGSLFTTWEESSDADSPWIGWSEFGIPSSWPTELATLASAVAGRLPDSRIQLWMPSGIGIFTRWQAEVETNSPWSGWEIFLPNDPRSTLPENGQVACSRLSNGQLQLWMIDLMAITLSQPGRCPRTQMRIGPAGLSFPRLSGAQRLAASLLASCDRRLHPLCGKESTTYTGSSRSPLRRSKLSIKHFASQLQDLPAMRETACNQRTER